MKKLLVLFTLLVSFYFLKTLDCGQRHAELASVSICNSQEASRYYQLLSCEGISSCEYAISTATK